MCSNLFNNFVFTCFYKNYYLNPIAHCVGKLLQLINTKTIKKIYYVNNQKCNFNVRDNTFAFLYKMLFKNINNLYVTQ